MIRRSSELRLCCFHGLLRETHGRKHASNHTDNRHTQCLLPVAPPPLLPCRALYIINWIYRYFTEPHYSQWIAWVAGVVQTLFYADFFYYFALSKAAGLKAVVLPQ